MLKALAIGLLGVCASAAVLNVPAGGNLQSAINSAKPGDSIVLAPGAKYIGNFTLPQKSGAAEILIQTNMTIPSGRPTPGSATGASTPGRRAP